MTGPHIVRHLDFWLECLATFPKWDAPALSALVVEYQKTLESL
jgi:hypothetical protein